MFINGQFKYVAAYPVFTYSFPPEQFEPGFAGYRVCLEGGGVPVCSLPELLTEVRIVGNVHNL